MASLALIQIFLLTSCSIPLVLTIECYFCSDRDECSQPLDQITIGNCSQDFECFTDFTEPNYRVPVKRYCEKRSPGDHECEDQGSYKRCYCNKDLCSSNYECSLDPKHCDADKINFFMGSLLVLVLYLFN
uniref:Uncharacterized protein n=1 Tax=Acrobeloides nanus TaxID=290746 RepID=A0A914DJY2_9BILA